MEVPLLLGDGVLPSSLPDFGSGRGVLRLCDQEDSGTRVLIVREGVRLPSAQNYVLSKDPCCYRIFEEGC